MMISRWKRSTMFSSWAIVGCKSLTATVIGTLALVWLSQKLSVQGNYALVVQGGILIAVMMLSPEGAITGLVERCQALGRRLAARKAS